MRFSSLKQMLDTRRQREQIYCTADYWDSKAAELKGDAVSMWTNNHLNHFYHQEQLALFERYLPQVAGRQILDVGCGTGRITRYLAARGAIVTGIDFSSKAIAIAQKLSSEGNPEYEVRSLFDLDTQTAYDNLVSWGAIAVACQKRSELLDVLQRLRRSLKPGGKALLLEPIHQGFLHRVLDMNLQEFCAVMQEAGFQIEDVRHLHFWLTRMLLCYFPLPGWLTATGYHLGETVMKLTRHKAFGDYKAIYATANHSL